MSCATSAKRPPLEEVPIGTTPSSDTHDPVAVTTPAAPSATTSPSVAERAKALVARGDNAGARALIEPRVSDGTATPDEVTLLRGICKSTHDAACLAKIKRR